MAKPTRLEDQVKIRGIRRRWLMNSVAIVQPHTVLTKVGFWALSSILIRSRRMFTSTIFSSPK